MNCHFFDKLQFFKKVGKNLTAINKKKGNQTAAPSNKSIYLSLEISDNLITKARTTYFS